MRKSKLLISTPTPQCTRPRRFGEKYLRIFFEEFPELKLQFANVKDPVNRPISTIEEALEFWGQLGFYWRRKNAPVCAASVVETGILGPDRVSFTSNWNGRIDWIKLFRRMVSVTKSETSYLHWFTEPELGRVKSGSQLAIFQLGAAGAALQDGLPGIGWANFLGGSYAEEVDADRMRENGFEVEEFENGYLFKVCPEITMIRDDYETFDARRTLLRSFFREGLYRPLSREK